MKQRQRFLAKLSAVCVLLLGTTATNFAVAAETAPASDNGDRASTERGEGKGPVTHNDGQDLQHGAKSLRTEWGPIDTRITVINGPHSRPSAKTHAWKKSDIARPLGTPRDNHQVWKRSGNERVVRNAIGLRVRQPSGNSETASRTLTQGEKRTLGVNQPLIPRRAGVVKPIPPPLTASINRSMINGTGMGRPGSGAVGGAKRHVAGVINGTSFRPRHP